MHALLAPLVVDLALLGVRQHFISFRDGLELLLGLGVVGILVRMPPLRLLVVRLLDLALCRGLFHPEDDVVVFVARRQSDRSLCCGRRS